MSLITIGILFLAGFLSGVVNAIAGGGTFLTCGAMTMLGVPPISANATSSIAQFPGYITSTWAYIADIRLMWRGALVPWLLLAAGPWLRPKKLAQRTPDAPASLAGRIVQFFTSIYGGFFGAGMGVMMLATLGLTEGGDYHRLNALKNVLSIVIVAVAIIIFASGGVVAWTHAAIMVPGVALGGHTGVWTARRVPQALVRTLVVTVGLFLAGYYFTKG